MDVSLLWMLRRDFLSDVNVLPRLGCSGSMISEIDVGSEEDAAREVVMPRFPTEPDVKRNERMVALEKMDTVWKNFEVDSIRNLQLQSTTSNGL